MFQAIQLPKQSCSGQHWQWVSVGFTCPVVSLGFQNDGNAVNFWPSQMFIPSTSEGYWQVNNGSLSSTDWWPWAVVYVDGDDAATLTADDLRIETGSGPLGEGVRGPAGGDS